MENTEFELLVVSTFNHMFDMDLEDFDTLRTFIHELEGCMCDDEGHTMIATYYRLIDTSTNCVDPEIQDIIDNHFFEMI